MSESLGLAEPIEYGGLVEQRGGAAEGMIESEARHRWPVEETIPGIETREQVRDRGVEAFVTLAARHAGQSVIVVAHGTLIRLVTEYLAGIGEQLLLPNGHFIVATIDAAGKWNVLPAKEWSAGGVRTQ